MDIEQVRQLIELMEKHDLTELMVKDGEKRILLRRGPAGEPPVVTSVPAAAVPNAAPAPGPAQVAAGGQQAPAEGAAAAADAEAEGLVAIKSPMVGTFYAAPDPESPPYVKVGDQIEPDTVVCIVEAMKVFNEIKAEVAGTIEKVCVQNAQPVEFGQPLFMVRLQK